VDINTPLADFMSSCQRSVSAATRRQWILGLPGIALACAVARPAKAEPLSIRSETGRFTVRISGLGRRERLNYLHGFDFVLMTADGNPASGASIVLTGRRRDTNNSLPTAPRVTAAPGPGHYRAEGLRFHMPGEWRLILTIALKDLRDAAALDIVAY
jgi:hypothetical protein